MTSSGKPKMIKCQVKFCNHTFKKKDNINSLKGFVYCDKCKKEKQSFIAVLFNINKKIQQKGIEAVFLNVKKHTIKNIIFNINKYNIQNIQQAKIFYMLINKNKEDK